MPKDNELKLKIIEECIALKEMIEQGFIVLAGKLKKIRDEKLYSPQHESFWAFLQEDLKMSESQASKLITTYEVLVLKYGMTERRVLDTGGWNEAYLIAKQAKNKDEADDLIEKSSLMPPTEFRKVLADEKIGPHTHKWEIVNFRQCTKCGLREKIFQDD